MQCLKLNLKARRRFLKRFYLPKFVRHQNSKMDKLTLLTKIKEEQEKVISNLKNSVESYKSESDLDEDNTVDPEDYSRQSEAKDMQLRLEKMLQTAQNNLSLIEDNTEKSFEAAETGALIETEDRFFFVGISLPVFKLEGKEIITFSEDAPVFKNIKGKKGGDTFEFAGKDLKILEIK